MTVLTWKHGKSKIEAIADVQAALQESGHAKNVIWNGSCASAEYRMVVTLVDVAGKVTDEAVVIGRANLD